jgi:hypothetical protein
MVQLSLFPDDNQKGTRTTVDDKKPRLTLKAKKAALDDLYAQMRKGWDPNEGTERLMEWLAHDIRSASEKKG